MRRPTTTESETHVVLFTAGFLGRGFDSRRLHQNSQAPYLSAARLEYRDVYSRDRNAAGFMRKRLPSFTACLIPTLRFPFRISDT